MASRFSRPPYWLGIHSPALRGIVQIEHRGNRIDAQSVDMVVAPARRGRC